LKDKVTVTVVPAWLTVDFSFPSTTTMLVGGVALAASAGVATLFPEGVTGLAVPNITTNALSFQLNATAVGGGVTVPIAVIELF